MAKGLSDGYKITDCDFRWIFFLLRREGKLEMEYIIDACSGKSMNVSAGQKVTIIDLEGGQVVDFFAEHKENSEEFLSTGVTIDCNESLRLSVGIIFIQIFITRCLKCFMMRLASMICFTHAAALRCTISFIIMEKDIQIV